MAFCASESCEIELINELLRFDFDEDDSTNGTSSSSSRSDYSSCSNEDDEPLDTTVVSTKNKKRKINVRAATTNHLDLSILNMKKNDEVLRPRRRVRVRERPILYVFPSYDKCDSLIYFPHAMTRHINSGDFKNLSKLFSTHFDKSCDVTFSCLPTKPTGRTLVKVFECLNEVHPDTLMCVHNTKIVENQIIATAYCKFTSCRAIIDHLNSQSTQDPMLLHVLQMCSEESQIKRVRELFEERQEEYIPLIKSNTDMVVYLTIDIIMTLDEFSRRVNEIVLEGKLSSMKPVDGNYAIIG